MNVPMSPSFRPALDFLFRHCEKKSLFARLQVRDFMRKRAVVHEAVVCDPGVEVVAVENLAARLD